MVLERIKKHFENNKIKSLQEIIRKLEKNNKYLNDYTDHMEGELARQVMLNAKKIEELDQTKQYYMVISEEEFTELNKSFRNIQDGMRWTAPRIICITKNLEELNKEQLIKLMEKFKKG